MAALGDRKVKLTGAEKRHALRLILASSGSHVLLSEVASRLSVRPGTLRQWLGEEGWEVYTVGSQNKVGYLRRVDRGKPSS